MANDCFDSDNSLNAEGVSMGGVRLTKETQEYFRACRSLVVSNEDCEFKDTDNHSGELVLAVIKSYESVFLKPMLSHIQ